MKIKQTVRHFAAKRALTTPIIGRRVREKLVDLHVGVFLDRVDPDVDPETRRDHLAGFFDCTMDTYVAALQSGYPEAEAREITHVQANFDFFNHGWTEMMEFPADEIEDHYDRYREFFGSHDITIDDPLGEFRHTEVPEAPSTPEKLETPEHPHAAGGFADDVYVEDGSGELRVRGTPEPEEVDLDAAPGVSTAEE